MRHSPSPDFPTCWRPFDTPAASVTRHSHGMTSPDRENFGPNAKSSKPFDLASAGNQLPKTKLLHCSGQRREREGNSCHGETNQPEIWHTTGETTTEIAEAGIGSDRRGLRSVSRGVAPPHPGPAGDSPRTDRALSASAVRIAGTLRRRPSTSCSTTSRNIPPPAPPSAPTGAASRGTTSPGSSATGCSQSAPRSRPQSLTSNPGGQHEHPRVIWGGQSRPT